jgi:4-hydroxybenzoate polyprenyltransferase
MDNIVKQEINKSDPPLIVDLDGTIIKSDLLFEGLILLLRKHPLYFFHLFIWLLNGKLRLKEEIFKRVRIDPTLLPYNTCFLDFLKSEKENGRKLILATASPIRNAREIAEYLGLFSEVFGSEKQSNLKGRTKRDLLVGLFGDKGFDYAGNSKSDFVIFKTARKSLLVNMTKTNEIRCRRNFSVQSVFERKSERVNYFLKSIRVYQWTKNLLIFIPFITSHSWNNLSSVRTIIIAFLSVSFLASSGYIINDLLDLNGDRIHPRKRNRPIASGNFSIPNACIAAFLLAAFGFGLAIFIDKSLIYLLVLYFSLTIAYSLKLKTIELIDVFSLTALYLIRIFIGAFAINVDLSFWLLVFSIFTFFSLALVKRYTEIMLKKSQLEISLSRRNYTGTDLPFIGQIGISSGLMTVVVFALYINSPEINSLYSNPEILWILCFLLLYWISHIWHSAYKGKMTDDPIIFSLKNRRSMITIILMAITFILSL